MLRCYILQNNEYGRKLVQYVQKNKPNMHACLVTIESNQDYLECAYCRLFIELKHQLRFNEKEHKSWMSGYCDKCGVYDWWDINKTPNDRRIVKNVKTVFVVGEKTSFRHWTYRKYKWSLDISDELFESILSRSEYLEVSRRPSSRKSLRTSIEQDS